MKRRLMLVSPLALLGAQTHSYRFEREYGGQPGVLDVENVNGSITVLATRAQGVKVTADIELSAPTREDLELAKREMQFEPQQNGDVFAVQMRVPENRRWQRYSYRNNLTVAVPAAMRLMVRGVNGRIQVEFGAAPVRDVYVKNINGEIELLLPKESNADFQIKTMNGQIYTAFELAPAPVKEETKVTEQGMRRIVSRNRYTGGRLGRGGIEVLIEGLNGDVRILERKA
jgi:DUF4097 and DUF4098 domain-containing protein YvlB